MNPNTRLGAPRVARLLRSAAVLLGASLLPVSAQAQAPTGTILGNVKDSSGAAVPGAEVTATNLGTQFSRTHARPTPTGQYALPLLPVGEIQGRGRR